MLRGDIVGYVWWLTLLGMSPVHAAPPVEPDSRTEWKSLFDGRTLAGWQVLEKGEFAEHGPVKVTDGTLVMGAGNAATGVRYQKDFPKNGFEMTFEASRLVGDDFFCGLTFPVEDGSLTLILGGWGGWVVGLSRLNGRYAIDNESCVGVKFKQNTWYRVRLRVADSKIQVWIDDEPQINLDTTRYELRVSGEMKPCLPLGLATWNTTGAVRQLRYRHVDAATDATEVDR